MQRSCSSDRCSIWTARQYDARSGGFGPSGPYGPRNLCPGQCSAAARSLPSLQHTKTNALWLVSPCSESDASLPCAFTLISSNNTLYSRCFHDRSELFPGGEGKLLRPAAGVFAQCKQHMPTNCQWWLHPADAAAWLLELHAPRLCMIAVQTLRVRLLVACWQLLYPLRVPEHECSSSGYTTVKQRLSVGLSAEQRTPTPMCSPQQPIHALLPAHADHSTLAHPVLCAVHVLSI